MVAHKGTVKPATSAETPFLRVWFRVTGMVAAEEEVADVAELNVLRDLLRAQVAVVVKDGHVRGVVVEKASGGGGGEQEILIHKRSHRAKPPIFLHNNPC
jgi:hypothetical protein